MRAIIAESYERIHRSNLIGMGIIPLQYLQGQSADTLQLTGRESYTIDMPRDLLPGQLVNVKVCCPDTHTHPVLVAYFCFTRPDCAIVFFSNCFHFLFVQLSDGRSFQVKARFDTDVEVKYFKHGGILNYMVRKLL